MCLGGRLVWKDVPARCTSCLLAATAGMIVKSAIDNTHDSINGYQYTGILIKSYTGIFV